MSPPPNIAVIAAGAMGAAIGARLTAAGCSVYTHLAGRSEATKKRAAEAGMQDASLEDIVSRCEWFISVLPPSEAYELARKVSAAAAAAAMPAASSRKIVYVDANAVSPATVKKIYELFEGAGETFSFVDGCIIGGPPSDGYDPTIYASAHSSDASALEAFVGLGKYNLRIKALTGEGADVGDASALKMSYAGITKGITGLFTTMILSAHASSPATAQALLQELNYSQPTLLQRITKVVPPMVSKAYRWVGEMEEIAEFVGADSGETYLGLSKLYKRIENSTQDGCGDDIKVLEEFVARARETVE